MTVKDYENWLDLFLIEKKGQGLSPVSLKGTEYSVNKYLRFLGNESMSKTSYYEYINSLEVSPISKQHYARDLRSFLYWCQEEELIPNFKVSLPKAQETVPKIISEEDAKALLFRYDHSFSEDRMYAVICLVFSTGLRCRSIVNLKVDDVDFQNRTICVRETKSKKLIVLPMTDKLCRTLYKYTKKYKLTGYLFPSETGEQLQSAGLQSAYKRYARKRGVPYGIHSLRHYYATEAVKKGMTPFALQKVLGHSDLSITMKYVNLVNGDLANEMGKVDLL